MVNIISGSARIPSELRGNPVKSINNNTIEYAIKNTIKVYATWERGKISRGKYIFFINPPLDVMFDAPPIRLLLINENGNIPMHRYAQK